MFSLWLLLTIAGVVWATRDAFIMEKNNIALNASRAKMWWTIVKTALVSFLFFGFVSAILIMIIFEDPVGSSRYYHWTE